ncbi:MAG: autophagy protein atg9 [Cyphobasidiales sp. Tagirdzhanova-0007]|nr:MAG: autophagy protein atg9 [Cyphobasidiales sp. Tagirdzhanova-0007]
MLSSLLPRASLYSSIDQDNANVDGNSANHAYGNDSAVLKPLEDAQDVVTQEAAAHPQSERDSLPDPFEQDYLSAQRISSPEVAVIKDDSPALYHSMNVNPFEVDILHPEGKSQPVAPLITPTSLPGQPAYVYHQHQQEDEPPKSIMYEERMDTRRVAEDELWIQPVASSSTLPQTHEYSPNESTDPLNGLLSPSGSFQSSPNIPLSTPNGGTTASSTGLEGSKQIPWWLRESRRQSDAASVSSSIPPANSHTRLDQKSDLLSTSPILPLNKPVPYPTDTPAVSSPRHILQAAAKHLTNAQGSIRLPTNLSPKDRVLWSWINVEDLDTFLQDVYTFYVRKGLWSIALSNFLDLLYLYWSFSM